MTTEQANANLIGSVIQAAGERAFFENDKDDLLSDIKAILSQYYWNLPCPSRAPTWVRHALAMRYSGDLRVFRDSLANVELVHMKGWMYDENVIQPPAGTDSSPGAWGLDA